MKPPERRWKKNVLENADNPYFWGRILSSFMRISLFKRTILILRPAPLLLKLLRLWRRSSWSCSFTCLLLHLSFLVHDHAVPKNMYTSAYTRPWWHEDKVKDNLTSNSGKLQHRRRRRRSFGWFPWFLLGASKTADWVILSLNLQRE